jgi:hypothetical protein
MVLIVIYFLVQEDIDPEGDEEEDDGTEIMFAVAGEVVLVGSAGSKEEVQPKAENAFIGMGEAVPEFMEQGVHIDPSDIALLPAFGTIFTFYEATAVQAGL